MGQEIACKLKYRKRTFVGKAHLEGDHILFRGGDRLKVLFQDLTSVKAADGVLALEFAGGPAEFELGKAAEKWAQKILNPPSLLEKLGAKRGLEVRLAGAFPEEFREELMAGGVRETAGKVHLVFFAAEAAADLARLVKLATGLKPGGALWVVYPKGVDVIREKDVLEAGRGAGLKDVKVVKFSQTHTGLKFMVPIAKR
jgi:hypothetical protein